MQRLILKNSGVMLLLALTGCASTQQREGLNIGEGLVFSLLSPASFGQQVILTQLVTITHGEREQELMFYSQIDEATVNIAGLLPDGTRLFSITYAGESVQSEGNAEILAQLDPDYLMADMQMALWPLSALQQMLLAENPCFGGGSCQLLETPAAMQRTLTKDDRTILDVFYDGDPHYRFDTRYEHRSRNYSLHIETLNVELLEE